MVEKNNKGITLVALVVTVIVLIILASVTLVVVLGNNGIIGNAQNAKNSTELAEIKEQIQRDFVRKERDAAQNRTEVSEEDIREVLNKYGTIIEEDGEILGVNTSKGEISLEDLWGNAPKEQLPPIPSGFTASTKAGETSIDDGFVIIGPDGSEFVWVPVETPVLDVQGMSDAEINNAIQAQAVDGKYPMALKINTTDYKGVSYAFSGAPAPATITPSTYSSTGTNYIEPLYLTDSTNGDANLTNNTTGITQMSLQTEYNKMVKSVLENKGFYVGRYETSINGTTAQSKSEKMPMVDINWYNMYEYQSNYTKNNNINNSKSSMIWGCQGDQICIWLKDISNPNWANHPYIVMGRIWYGVVFR